MILDTLPVTWINKPYFDLNYSTSCALHIRGIEFSYQNLINNSEIFSKSKISNPVTQVHPVYFRESLIRETKLFQYNIDNPRDLHPALRSERWDQICEFLENYQDLNISTRIYVIDLLLSLCFHRAVPEYIPKMPALEISRQAPLAKLAYYRAMANLMSCPDAGNLDNLREFEHIAHYAVSGSTARLNATNMLTILNIKTFRELQAGEFWKTQSIQELDNLEASLDDFSFIYQSSVLHRAIVLIPLFCQDRGGVVREMDACQALAEKLLEICQDEVQEIAAHENLTTVFESRTKEALWLGDVDLAEMRARQVVDRDPYYPKYRLQLGEVLLKKGKIDEAANMYRSAARLGPPGTPIAWFMAGQCHETLGELELACDCYLASIQMDELAISAVKRLNKLASRLDNQVLESWSTLRLNQLLEQQKNMPNNTASSYIPAVSSELKNSGKLTPV
jgi:tetratricopeptide (TPR) repeat protein